MEVVHQGDSITHAVIGGKAAITMKTDDSAHLMHMLSKALYKDQILAVCREVICNAWDSHIASGITDKPIEISLVDDILSITDFGAGIPYDKMGEVYGTYGGSTKKDSTDQTGGFGLGCKSPFAYTEHFDVISTHNGERTMYKVTKSSAEIAGKPGIIPISSFQHPVNGLTVKIRLNPLDVSKFRNTIARVVRNGEINATYNGVLMTDLLEFSNATQSWLLTRSDVYPGETGKIFVRYGNVIYPIDNHDEYIDLYRKSLEKINFFTNAGFDRMNIVLMAEPDSLSIAPSRETLSMQDHTIKSIKKLLTNFLNNSDKVIEPELKKVNREQVDNLIIGKNVRRLLTRRAIPMDHRHEDGYSTSRARREQQETVYDFRELAGIYMRVTYPDSDAFWQADIKNRLKKMVKHKLLNKQLVASFMKSVKINGWSRRRLGGGGNNWATKNIVGPVKAALREQGLSTGSLYAYDVEDNNWQHGGHYLNKCKFHETKYLLDRCARDVLPYLRRIVVLAYGKKNTEERIEKAMQSRGMAGGGELAQNGILVYIVNKKKETIEKAREALKGYQLVDLTVRQSYEAETVKVEPKERKPRVKGYVSLNAMWETTAKPDPNGVITQVRSNTVNFRRFLNEEVATQQRILKPEFIFQQSMAQGRNYYSALDRLMGLSVDDTKKFMKHFGNIGAVTNSQPQVDRAFKCDGIPSLQQWLIAQMQKRLADPAWRAMYANSYDAAAKHVYKKGRAYVYSDPVQKKLIELVHNSPYIAEAFDMPNTLSNEDRVLLHAFHTICEFDNGRNEVVNQLNMIYPSAASLKVEYLIQKSRLTGLVDIDAARRIINSTSEADAIKKAVVDFIIQAIKA